MSFRDYATTFPTFAFDPQAFARLDPTLGQAPAADDPGLAQLPLLGELPVAQPAPGALLGNVGSAALPDLAAVAGVDPANAALAQDRLRQAALDARMRTPGGTTAAREANDAVAPFLSALRTASPETKQQLFNALGQQLEEMWWNNDPRLGPLVQSLLAGMSPEDAEMLLNRLSQQANKAVRQGRNGGRIPRAGHRQHYYNHDKQAGASGVARSDKTIKDTNVPAASKYPPGSDKAKALFREASKLAGVPESWADSPALHNILSHESGGVVGRPNYTYGSRAKDPSQWGGVHDELKAGHKSTISSATGLGQLILPNVDRYYPAGRKGIGDPLQEAAGMMAYIKDRYGSPENAWARYGRGHEGY